MKAMLLAAGRGERMRPLTDHTPKPLLKAGGKPLIVWHLEKLAAAGFREVVINHAWLGEQSPEALGDGSAFGLRLQYSAEAEALETAGGIARALPLLTAGEPANAPFAVISSDVWSDAGYDLLIAAAKRLDGNDADCWCLMVDDGRQHLLPNAGTTATGVTYAGIGVFSPAMFSHMADGMRAPLRPLLELAIETGHALGTRHTGRWFDIGTPERLAELDRLLAA